MPTSFETFINNELPLRVSTLDTPVSGDIPVFTGVGLLTEAKTIAELDLVLSADLGSAAFTDSGDYEVAGAAATAQSNAENYADALVTKVWKDQGNFDVGASLGVWPTASNTIGELPIKAGNLWVVAGAATDGTTMTGGKVVSNGDTIRAIIDAATDSSADWAVNEGNLGYTPENQANKDTDGTLAANSDTKYPTQKAVKTYAEPKLPAAVGSSKFLREDKTWQDPPAPVLTEANFSVAKTGQPTYTITLNLTALTGAKIWTAPDVAVDIGALFKSASYSNNTGQLTLTNAGNGTSIISLGTYYDSVFRVKNAVTTTKQLGFDCVDIGASTLCTIKAPITTANYTIPLGSLSFVATADSNVLGGTGCRIEGGTNNNVSGTSNESINCFYTTMTGTRNTAINCGESGGAFTCAGTENTFINCRAATLGSGSVQCTFQDIWNTAVSLNTATFPSGTKLQGLNFAGFSADSALQGIQSASTAVQCLGGGSLAPYAYISQATSFEGAFHEIDIIAQETSPPYMAMLGRRHVTFLNNNSGGSVFTVTTVGTDVTKNGAAYTITITEVLGRLVITCNMTSSAATVLWRCRVRSTYQ